MSNSFCLLAASDTSVRVDDEHTLLSEIRLHLEPVADFVSSLRDLRHHEEQRVDDITGFGHRAEDIRGSVADVLRRLDEKLKAHNWTSVEFVSGSTERQTALYPVPAIQQITRNAVMHRTYEATNAPVHVRWFEDRIEVISPGGPFGRVTAANFGSAGAVDYRNPNLAEALRTLGFVQRFGVGIPTAQHSLRRAGHPEASFSVDQSSVLATIPSIANREGQPA